MSGIPGLVDLPIVGRLFAHSKKETNQTDVVLTLTPHIIRVLDLSEEDLRPFKVGGDAAAPALDLPIIPQTPPVTVPGPDAPAAPPPVQAQAGPIRPPAAVPAR